MGRICQSLIEKRTDRLLDSLKSLSFPFFLIILVAKKVSLVHPCHLLNQLFGSFLEDPSDFFLASLVGH